MNTQEVEPFLANSRKHIILDIRSKKDFEKGHLPNAISLPFPIMLKELRRQHGQKLEVKKLSTNIKGIAVWKEQILAYLDRNTARYIYCQAGGLRSAYFHQTLDSFQDSLIFLSGGYNAFCDFQKDYFEKLRLPELYVLKGKTGCGKTETIAELAKRGQQVIPLATLAQHRGSVFGNLPGLKQPSVDQFHHELLYHCLSLDLDRPICIEQEGAFIGSVSIPKPLIAKFNQGKTIQLDIPKPARVAFLLEQYSQNAIPDVLRALKKIEKRFQPSDFQKALELVKQNRKEDFVSLVIDYYDSSRMYQVEDKNPYRRYELREVNPCKTAINIINDCCLQ